MASTLLLARDGREFEIDGLAPVFTDPVRQARWEWWKEVRAMMNMLAIYSRQCTPTIAILLALSAPGVGLAQSVNAKVDATALPDYHPSMGDLMTMAVQPRHIKLGLAGQQKNWAYAKYELSELRNAFARIGRTIPTYQSVDTAALTAGIMGAPLNAVEKAIDANSATQFNAAYLQLTEACNICHRNRTHSVVVIKVPDTTGFLDQDFVPISAGSLPSRAQF